MDSNETDADPDHTKKERALMRSRTNICRKMWDSHSPSSPFSISDKLEDGTSCSDFLLYVLTCQKLKGQQAKEQSEVFKRKLNPPPEKVPLRQDLRSRTTSSEARESERRKEGRSSRSTASSGTKYGS